MAVLRPTRRFEKSFKRLDARLQQRAAKSITQFSENPRHGHLHFEKLKGSDYLTIRVDSNFRIVLREAEKGVYDLVDVGSHTDVYQAYG